MDTPEASGFESDSSEPILPNMDFGREFLQRERRDLEQELESAHQAMDKGQRLRNALLISGINKRLRTIYEMLGISDEEGPN